ncbi:prolyl oligopeptidase family serine peptidase [Undibacterium seohonense]|uniref:prolyl oligopeptidase n=1 Tax=Undibacterium seohonense TaxID=1344950 RepID=A0ABR6X9Z4_9BURK|nr:prolyl oligopeptidase family serine peptidase [Undibacterium seohonense]MBC3809655.1 prolyl oligopeptidase family serine peptidase [Undibacterium seohonense]
MSHAISRRDFVQWAAASSLIPSVATATQSKKIAPASISLPPKARIATVVDKYWGVEVSDDYRWMETQPKTAEWDSWLRAQADYARANLDALPERAAMLKRLELFSSDADSLRNVLPAGGRIFIEKRLKGEQAFKVFVRDSLQSAERVLIDPDVHRQSEDVPATVDYFVPSPTGKHIAYGVSIGGSEISTTYIKNVSTGDTVEITKILSRGSGWNSDGSVFFYYRVRADAVPGSPDFGRGGSCWMHRLGTTPNTDREVFRNSEGPDFDGMEDDLPVVRGALGSNWILGMHLLNGNDISQVYVTKAQDLLDGKPQWRKIAGKSAGVKAIDLIGDTIYALAKGRESRGEIVKIHTDKEDFASGKIVLPAKQGVLNALVAARDGIYVADLARGLYGLQRISLTDQVERLHLPQAGSVWGMFGALDEDGPWYNMDDLTIPGTTYKVNAQNLHSQKHQFERPLGFDVSRFKTTRIDAPTRDGVKVPLEILHRKDITLNRRNPLLMIAYGAYGTILDQGFSSANMAFLDAGGVIVYAHVRGGGELGDAWHLAGKKATKPNTWRDAIDSAEHLIKLGWTDKKHLALWGTSAGGIMVGRAITERPDLFAVAIGEVGAFNVLRFELTANGPGNDVEFGTVKKEDEFHSLLKMDAYHAVKNGVRYPACLLITGANDLRVEPWQVGKFAARMQAASTNVPGALLRVNYETGHFATSRKNGLEKMADIFSFVLHHTK